MYKKILLPTDGSEHSLKAAKKAIEIARQDGSMIVMYHAEMHYYVPEQRQIGFPFLSVPPLLTISKEAQYIEFRSQFKIWGEKMLKVTEEIFKKENMKVESRLILDVTPEKYAESVIKKEGFDLVVVGCKGHHSALRQVFLGSVAEKIVNTVPCDVLVVR